MISAKVIEKSVSPFGKVITTFELRYPRFIHSEFMTHRMFSRNASSSRAIPVAKILDSIMCEPARPIHWGANQPGMQANEELGQPAKVQVQSLWNEACNAACELAAKMTELGAHKQIVNRITEPFQHISVIVTATEWPNFYELRNHPDAQPEIHELARVMLEADANAPETRRTGSMSYAAAWHLPYVTEQERVDHSWMPELLCRISAARCARVSYLTHDGQSPSIEKDLALFDRLVGGVPLHASPIEHQAVWHDGDHMSRNFRGWTQHREIYEASIGL